MNMQIIADDLTYYFDNGKAYKKPTYKEMIGNVRSMKLGARTDLDECFDEGEII